MVSKTRSAPGKTQILTNQNRAHCNQAVRLYQNVPGPGNICCATPTLSPATCWLFYRHHLLGENSTVDGKKKAQPESCEIHFIWGQMRTIAQETACQIALRNCSIEVREDVSIHVILVKGHMWNEAHVWQKVVSSHSRKADVSVNDFSAFLDMRRCKKLGSSNLLLKISEDLLCQFFPEHRVPPSWSPPWTPFRGCWRSAAAVAHDLILVEPHGERQFLVGTTKLVLF